MRILIAIDGTSQAEAVLSLGRYLLRNGLADQASALLNVTRHEEDRAWAEGTLAKARQSLDVAHLQTKVRVGRPDHEVLHETQQGRYDLVIVGEGWRPRRPLACATQRLTAVRVAQRAPCPVLLAFGRARCLGLARPLRILLCDSGARSSLATVNGSAPPLGQTTARLAEQLGAEEEVTVLHVMSQLSAGPGVRGKQLRAGIDELVAEHAPEAKFVVQDMQVLRRPGIHPQAKVRHGLVVEEILGEARSGDYDLVIIGTNQGKGWQHFLLEDLAHQILLKIDRTVLVVH